MADPTPRGDLPPDGYTLVFDITREGYRDWWFPAFGLIFVALGVAAVVYVRRARSLSPRRGLAIGAWAMLTFSILWTVGFEMVSYRQYAQLVQAVKGGALRYVEGQVENFVPMPANGHGVERFEVQGRRFEYSHNVLTAGFNKTSTQGGPIRPGLHVRVGYVGDTIVRLEIR